jgi:hypothetical protein
MLSRDSLLNVKLAKSLPSSSRDNGWGWADVGALCLSGVVWLVVYIMKIQGNRILTRTMQLILFRSKFIRDKVMALPLALRVTIVNESKRNPQTNARERMREEHGS